jgi:hypothetical protein
MNMYDFTTNDKAMEIWGRNLYKRHTAMFVHEILEGDGNVADKAVRIANRLIQQGFFEGDDPDIIKAVEQGLLIAYDN